MCSINLGKFLVTGRIQELRLVDIPEIRSLVFVEVAFRPVDVYGHIRLRLTVESRPTRNDVIKRRSTTKTQLTSGLIRD